MTSFERPDLENLKRLLREGKATSAKSQEILNDPQGAKLIADYCQVLDVAIKQGHQDVAAKAAATLADLLAKEAELSHRVEATDTASQEVIAIIVENQ